MKEGQDKMKRRTFREEEKHLEIKTMIEDIIEEISKKIGTIALATN